MNKLTALITILLISSSIYSQYQIGIIPRDSPDKGVYHKVGYTEVEVKYGSPAVKNRNIWGELVPYNTIWRAGANNATTVHFKSDVIIDNNQLDSSTYALFIIPRENDKWTVIFSHKPKQWGAFSHKQEDEVLRVDVLPRIKDDKTEHLTYSIRQVGFRHGIIVLRWDHIEIEIPFETNYLRQFEEEVELRASKQDDDIKWIVYLQGAEHLEEIQSNSELAFTWINEAEKLMDSTSEWSEQFYPRDYIKGHLYWTKAKLYAQNGNLKNAIEYAERVTSMEDDRFYARKKDEESIDENLDAWKKKP